MAREPPCGDQGDVTDTGNVSGQDAQVIVNNIEDPSEIVKERGDVDNDGEITIFDAQIVLDYAEGKIDTFDSCSDTGDPSPEPSPGPSPSPSMSSVRFGLRSPGRSLCPGNQASLEYEFRNTSETSIDYRVVIQNPDDSIADSSTGNISAGSSTSFRTNVAIPASSESFSAFVEDNITGNRLASSTFTPELGKGSISIRAEPDSEKVCSGSTARISADLSNNGDCTLTGEASIDIGTEDGNVLTSTSETVEIRPDSSQSVSYSFDMPSVGVAATVSAFGKEEVVNIGVRQPEIAITDSDIPEGSKVGDDVSMSTTLSSDNRCSSDLRIRIVDIDTGNDLTTQTSSISGNATKSISSGFEMPSKRLNGKIVIEGEVNDSFEQLDIKNFTIVPYNAIVIDTENSITAWGPKTGELVAAGRLKASGVSGKELESNDRVTSLPQSTVFLVRTSSADSDVITFDSMSEVNIKTKNSVTFVVDGEVQGQGSDYQGTASFMGTLGVLPRHMRMSRIN